MLKNGGLYVCKGTTFECLKTTEVERVDLEGTPSSESFNPSPNQRHACICCPEIAEFCFGKKVKSTGLLFSSSGGRLVPQRLWVVMRETVRLRALGQYRGEFSDLP